MAEVKVTDYGLASPGATTPREIPLSKEDQRSTELAIRAQRGDYDDGMPQWAQK